MNTKAKRRSAIHTLLPFFPGIGEPDGSIDQGDRQESVWVYRGILAFPPAVAIAFDAFRPSVSFVARRPAVDITAEKPVAKMVVR